MKHNQSRQEIDKFSSDVKMLKRENAMLQDELRNAKESIEKAPSSVMSSLVDKLRADLAEKEKKQRAMGRIIADLKNELVNNAVAKEQKMTPVLPRHHQLEPGTETEKEALEEARRKIEDLNHKNDNLSKQVDTLKAKQVIPMLKKRCNDEL